MTNAEDQKWLCRVGGISAIALGAAYIVIIGLYVPMGVPSSGTEARLAYVARNTTAWWAILWLSVLTDLLFIPVALSLYGVLKESNRSAMVLAMAFIALFVVLDLAITWTNYAVLIMLAAKYAQATSEAQKMVAITAAEYPTSILESTFLFFCNTLVLAVGILITGIVMWKRKFGKIAAYLAVITGMLGIVSVFGPLVISALRVTIIVTSALTTIWLFVAGYRLLAFGRPGATM